MFFSSLRSDDIEKERKRHDLALEQLTKARDEWSNKRIKYLDYINDRPRKEANAKKTFTDINEAMNEYYVARYRRSFRFTAEFTRGAKDFYVSDKDKKLERSYLSSLAWES